MCVGCTSARFWTTVSADSARHSRMPASQADVVIDGAGVDVAERQPAQDHVVGLLAERSKHGDRRC